MWIRRDHSTEDGFTLLELTLVVMIMSAIMAMTVPVVLFRKGGW